MFIIVSKSKAEDIAIYWTDYTGWSWNKARVRRYAQRRDAEITISSNSGNDDPDSVWKTAEIEELPEDTFSVGDTLRSYDSPKEAIEYAKRSVRESNTDTVAVVYYNRTVIVVIATDDANGVAVHKLKTWPEHIPFPEDS